MRTIGFRSIGIGLLALLASTVSAEAATETVLYSFPSANLGNPLGQLHMRNGALYGTASGFTTDGPGQVFELKQSHGTWKLKTILAFNGANGSVPRAGLIADSSGALYGTTAEGGAYGKGNVFRLAKSGGTWTSDTIWDFGGNDTDGANPEAPLIIDSGGALYGTTSFGGTNHEGTVFRLTQSGDGWTEDVLYRFTNNYDGYTPAAGLYMDESGALFGTTYRGGPFDYGTVFTLTNSGDTWSESRIYNFRGGTDGEYVEAGLTKGPHGTLYGETLFAGQFTSGTVFQLTPHNGSWKKTVIHDFSGSDGDQPYATLVRGKGGTLYGATAFGGTLGDGTVFSLKKSGGGWTETVIHSFGTGHDGANPYGVVVDDQGNLWGTTFFGGKSNNGTIWEITP